MHCARKQLWYSNLCWLGALLVFQRIIDELSWVDCILLSKDLILCVYFIFRIFSARNRAEADDKSVNKVKQYRKCLIFFFFFKVCCKLQAQCVTKLLHNLNPSNTTFRLACCSPHYCFVFDGDICKTGPQPPATEGRPTQPSCYSQQWQSGPLAQ